MNLRRTTLFILLITFIGITVSVFFNLRLVLLPTFAQEERNTMELNIQRSVSVLEIMFDGLDQTARDWSRWDDTYNFVVNRNTSYLEDNLRDTTFKDLQVNLIAFLNTNGSLVYGKAFDLTSGTELPFPEDFLKYTKPGSPVVMNADSRENRHGYLSLANHPVMLIAAPILTTDGEGPSRGTFIIGIYLDENRLESIARAVRLPLEMVNFDQAAFLPAYAGAQQSFRAGVETLSLPVDDQYIAGFYLIRDFYGQPQYILRLEQARVIYQRGRQQVLYMLGGLMLILFVFGLITIWLLENYILSRMLRLSREVAHIGKSGDLKQRVTATRADELSQLSSDINQMLADLDSAQRERRQSEERFRMLVQSMDDVVFTIDPNLLQVDIAGIKENPRSLPAVAVMSNSLAKDAQGAQAAIHRDAAQHAVKGEHVTYEWSAEVNGTKYTYQNTLSPILDDQGQVSGIVGVGRDITRLKQLEIELRQRIGQLDVLYEASQVLLGALGRENAYQNICRLVEEKLDQAAAWIGELRPEEPVLYPVYFGGLDRSQLETIPYPWSPTGPEHPAAEALRDSKAVVVLRDTPEAVALRPFEKEFAVITAVPLYRGEDCETVLCIYSRQAFTADARWLNFLRSFARLAETSLKNADLFEQVQSGRQRLEKLSRRLVEVQEEERGHIAKALHDEVGQILTGLSLMLNMVDANAPSDKIDEMLQQAHALLNELIHRVRQMSQELRPSSLDDLGLLPTLYWYLGQFQKSSGIQVQFRHSEMERRFAKELETSIYRVVQEALSNVDAHAQAQNVKLRVWCTEKAVLLQVEDDGVGFDARTTLAQTSRGGLAAMRERVTWLGGQFAIESGSGQGTRIDVEIPLTTLKPRRAP